MVATRDTAGSGANTSLRLESIVAGVDFSATSVAAVDWIRRHLAPDARCVVVHALDVPQPPRFMRDAFPAPDEVLRSAREGAAARLERLRTARDWGDVRFEIREGRPEDVIGAATRDADTDLLVVGEHARPRGSWAAPGSTAEALVHAASVPVLLARNPQDHPPGRILVAVDDSDHARLALAWARMLAKMHGARITVSHVFRPIYLNLAKSVSGIDASAALEQKQLDQTREWLDGFVRDAGFASGEVDVRIEHGDPAASLVAAQRGGGYDLVVIGSRGAGGASRMLLGSVANGVLRGASCPVLVVRDSGAGD